MVSDPCQRLAGTWPDNAMADEAEAMDVEVQQEDSDKQKVNANAVALRACRAHGSHQATKLVDLVQGKDKFGKRFEIKKWNAVAMWSWAICTDTCAICRNNLYEPSIEYQANPTGDADHPGLSIAWGNCGHVFHLDCIQRWLKTRSACPLCNKEWEFAKIEKILPGGSMAVE